MSWQITVGFEPRHWQMLLDIEEALWESSVFSGAQVGTSRSLVIDGYTEEIEQAHQHIKDAIAIFKEVMEVTA